MTEVSNTDHKQKRAAPSTAFKKGDPRINRKGRPRAFDKLRELAQTIAVETVIDPKTGKPAVVNGHALTRVEGILRQMAADDPARFIEIAYGKVPNPVEITGQDGGAIQVEAYDYNSAIAALAPRPSGDSDASR